MVEFQSAQSTNRPADHPTTRLLTLTGAGGCGKTRLALQVAADLVEDFADGVWFVELAPLADPALIAPTIATTLGILQQEGRTIETILLEYMRDKSCLLVLDNCEHLIDASARLADALLHASPQIKILASSREALGIAGETAFRVPSLQIPNPKEQIPISNLTQYESVRLFVERARAAQQSFQVGDTNAPAIAQICARLDGIPLALELAAARVKVIAVEQIAERLNDRFRLLTGGSRTALPRQQTLRATIDWGFDLLSEPERVLLRRLSVFAGGWTLEAAEEVCAEEQMSGRASVLWSAGDFSPLHPRSPAPLLKVDVLDLTSCLVDKSLVIAEEENGAARYRMLETVRQCAREKLLDSDEGERVRARHVDFFVQFAETAEPQLYRAKQAEWLNRLEVEHDNLRAAADWASESGMMENGLRLSIALSVFCYFRGYWSEWLERVTRFLSQTENLKTKMRTRALIAAGRMARWQFDLPSARVWLERSIAASSELDDQETLAWATCGMGEVDWFEGKNEAARQHGELALDLFRQVGNKLGMAYALTYISLSQLRNATARSLLEQSLVINQELGNKFRMGVDLLQLGSLAKRNRDYQVARGRYEKGISILREVGVKPNLANALGYLGEVHLAQGDHTSARALYEEEKQILRKIGYSTARALVHLGRLELLENRVEQAVANLRDSLIQLSEQANMAPIVRQYGAPVALDGMAEIAIRSNQPSRAITLLGATESLYAPLSETSIFFFPFDIDIHARILNDVRAQVDEATFTAAWNEGRAMTLEQAIEYALSDSG